MLTGSSASLNWVQLFATGEIFASVVRRRPPLLSKTHFRKVFVLWSENKFFILAKVFVLSAEKWDAAGLDALA
jgi:hypothetical protein